jgi:hypothetical protein
MGFRTGPTTSLALALFHKWEPERLFVIVTVYIDESGTHDSGVTIMAGWVGRLGQWATFDPKWRKLLKRNQLSYYHSRKLKHSKGEFKDWSIIRKNAFMKDAAEIGLKNLAFGFVIALSEKVYRKHYLADHRPKEVQLDSRYGLCFRYCLSLIPTFAKERFGERELNINFVLESGHNNAGDAVRIFNRVKNQRMPNKEEQEIVKMLGTIAFDDKKAFPGLQAADVAAYSAYQHETGAKVLEVGIVPNENTVKLARKIQRVPVFRLEIVDTVAMTFRQFILNEIEEKKSRRKNSSPSADSPSGEQLA